MGMIRLFLCLSLAAAAVAQTTAPTQVHEAILQLGAASAADRERAMQWLASVGEPARAELEHAARSSDPEMRSRARQLLGDLQLGMGADTPREIRESVRSYRSGDAAQKRLAIQSLLQQGPVAVPLLARLAVIEADPAVRQELIAAIGRDAPSAASVFIAADQLKQAREILETAAESGAKPHLQALTALLVLTDAADARIATLRKLAPAAMPRHQSALLAHLLRAKGDLAAARDMAAAAHDDDLRADVVLGMGDFRALSALLAGAQVPGEPRNLLQVALSQLFGGDRADFEKSLALLKGKKAEKESRMAAVVACLMDDRPADALALLSDDDDVGEKWSLLSARHDYAAALRFGEKALAAGVVDGMKLRCDVARQHANLGQAATARDMFDGIFKDVRGGARARMNDTYELLRAERLARMDDAAFQHAAAVMSGNRDNTLLMMALFPDHHREAIAWQNYLFQIRGLNNDLPEIRRIIERQAPAGDVERMVRDAASRPVVVAPRGMRRPPRVDEMIDTLMAYGRVVAVRDVCARLAASQAGAEPLMKLGNMAAKENQWKQAAEYYARAAAREPQLAAPMYLRGISMKRSGQEQEGSRLVARAQLLPLADESQRSGLADALRDAGLTEDARQQELLMARIGDADEPAVANLQRRMGEEAFHRGDYAASLLHWRRFTLRYLDRDGGEPSLTAVLYLVHWLHRARCCELLAGGKYDEAQREMDAWARSLPADVELPIDAVSLLRKAGREAMAADVLNHSIEFYRKLLAAYPESSALHNGIAWMLARCRTRLDEALVHALKAVELEKDNCAILDTLAEVYFQRGEKDKAIEMIQRCMAIEPDNARHKQCRARFEKLPATTEPPEETDDF
jgi:hypothetical protein